MNDPREMAIRPESGVTLEQDNRVETMYHWGAMITDLCDLPVSEYMKPMTVIVYGNGGGDYDDPDYPGTTLKTENVKIWFTVLKNGNEITDEPETVFAAGEDAEIIWTARWEWTGTFSNSIQVAAVVQTDQGTYNVSAILNDNEEKRLEKEIVEAKGSEAITSYKSYGVASTETPVENVTGSTYTETVTDENTKYKFEISSAETIVYLTLKLVGATSYTNMEMRYGNDIPFDKVSIEKEGYDFLYWTDSKGKEYTGTTMPAQNLTLTAKYEVKKCQVDFVFVIDGVEELVSSTTVNYGSKITRFPSTSVSGYDFKGWEPSTSTVIKEDTTFRATFESKKYTVTWSGYTDGPLVQEYKYGEAIEVPEAPEKEGYTFTKWDKTIPSAVTTNLKFTAQFTINQYVITYSKEWYGVKSELSAFTKNYGTTITLPKVPTEKGYTYSEWQSEYTGTTVPAHNVEYVTVKTANTYILAYYDNGELVKEDEYEYMETIIPYSYEKPGYVVSEWTNLPTQMPYNNVSAHCTSEIMRFTVTFMDQNGNIVETVEGVPYGTEINTILPMAPEGYSYEFDEVVEGQVKSEMTISLFKVVNKYDVTINGEIVSLAYGTDIIAYVNDNYKAEEGYHIVITASHDTVPADNTATVEFVFEANVWVLTYSTEGADENISGSEEVAFGTNIFSVLPSTDKEGYIFNGWFDEEKQQQLSAADTMPNNNLTVIGTYDIKSFEVTIFDEDNKIFNKSYVYKTKLSSVLNDEAIVEYVTAQSANGQTVSFVLNGEPINEEMEITSNIDIYVEKTPNEYLLTFMNGNEIISEALVKFGETIKYPPMENKTEGDVEYVFVWEGKSYNGEPMPAKDLKIVGNYQEKAEAPIYYGVFVTSSTTADSKIYNDSDLKQYFKTVKVNDCLDGEDIAIEMAKDPELLDPSLSDREFEEYQGLHLYPACFLIPVDADEKYEFIAVLKADNKQKNFVTDGVDIDIEGNKYHLYTFLNPDSMKAQDFNQNWKYNIILK
jgi:hypothetical protein